MGGHASSLSPLLQSELTALLAGRSRGLVGRFSPFERLQSLSCSLFFFCSAGEYRILPRGVEDERQLGLRRFFNPWSVCHLRRLGGGWGALEVSVGLCYGRAYLTVLPDLM